MKRFLIIAFVCFLVICLLGGGIVFYILYHKKEIQEYALKQLNRQMRSELKATEIDITFFRSFPDVSIDMTGVTLSEPSIPSRSLMRAKHILIGFNLYKLLNKEYRFQTLRIDSAECNLLIFKDGRTNFNLLKTEKGKDTSTFLLDLNKVILDDVHVTLHNRQTMQQYDLVVHDGEFTGKFSDKIYDLEVLSKCHVNTIRAGKVNFASNRDVELNLGLSVDKQRKVTRIRHGKVETEGLVLESDGFMETRDKETLLNVHFRSTKAGIAEILSLLPFGLPESIRRFKSDGKAWFEGTVKGIATPASSPAIEVKFGVENGSLSNEKKTMSVDHINMKGTYSNGSRHNLESSVIDVSAFNGRLHDRELECKFNIRNFRDPVMQLEMNGSAALEKVIAMFPSENIKEIDGEVIFTLSARGRLKQTGNSSNWSDPFNRGSIRATVKKLILKNSPAEMRDMEVEAAYANGEVTMSKCRFSFDEVPVSVEGKINGLMNMVFGEVAVLRADLILSTGEIDLKKLPGFSPGSPDSESRDTGRHLMFDVSLQAKIGGMKYEDFTAKDVSCRIEAQNETVNITSLKAGTAGGNISGNISGKRSVQGNWYITGTSVISGVELQELFRELNNFGQGHLTHKHLKGSINATIDFAGVWDKDFKCRMDKLYAFADLNISNGEIIEYKPLEALSSYANVKELQHLKFNTLKNKIEIKDRTILIPAMDVGNNALNMTISGRHSFDNYLDYKIKLKLSDLLKKKRSKKENEFGEEDEKGGGMNLYLLMQGPAGKLRFSYDKLSVKNKMKEDVQVEKENIKNIFKNEFRNVRDTSLRKLEKRDEKNEELEFEEQ